MKPYIKLYSLIMLCAFFLANITLTGCNDENSDEPFNEIRLHGVVLDVVLLGLYQTWKLECNL